MMELFIVIIIGCVIYAIYVMIKEKVKLSKMTESEKT